MTHPSIALGICTLGRYPDLEVLLKSVLYLSRPYQQVIVSDENHNAQTQQFLQVHYGFVQYIQGPAKGLGANRNRVIEHCTTDFLHFVDDDCELVSHPFEHCPVQNGTGKVIYAGFEIKKGYRVFACKANYLGFQKVPYQVHEAQLSFVINAAVFPMALLKEIPFDDQLLYGSDEIDWANRALVKGYSIRHCADFRVLHHHSALLRSNYQINAEISRVYVNFKKHYWLKKNKLAAYVYLIIAAMHLFKHWGGRIKTLFYIYKQVFHKLMRLKELPQFR